MKFNFIEDAIPAVTSDDPFYALTNGYICPENLLHDGNHLKALKDAISLVNDFIEQALDADLIEQI